MTEIEISFALALGSELVREEDIGEDADLSSLGAKDGVFGALVVDADGEEILDERYWDRLDLVLEHFLEALDEAADGNEGVAEFPETRVEVVIRPSDDDESEVELEVEDTVVTVSARDLRASLTQCVERLVDRFDDVSGPVSKHIDRLRSMIAE